MIRTRVGYAGGKQDKPTYRNIGDHTMRFRAIVLLVFGVCTFFSGCNLRDLVLAAGYINFISEDFEGI